MLAEELLQKSVELQELKAARGVSREASDESQQVLSVMHLAKPCIDYI